MILIMEVIGDTIHFIIPLTLITTHLFITAAGTHHGIPIFISATDGIITTTDGMIMDTDITMVIIPDIIQGITQAILIPKEEITTHAINTIITADGTIPEDFQEMIITDQP
jgi:hypothetical protein